MFARTTLLEIDTERLDMRTAVEQFRGVVLPELRKQAGYQGVYVLTTPEGKGLLLSLWDSKEAAEASIVSGYYAEQIEKFVTFFRSPPGREHYEVAIAEAPAAGPG